MKEQRVFSILMIVAALGCAAWMVPASWADAEKHKAGSLDGKTFVGEMGEKGQGKDKAEKDSFVFKDGTFRSTGCDRYGFTPTVYAAKTENGAVSFEAVSTSPKEGKMTWKGKATGGMIEGTAVWEKEGQKPIEYWFKASAKP